MDSISIPIEKYVVYSRGQGVKYYARLIEKAKYTKRTGGPGNYKYEYDDNNDKKNSSKTDIEPVGQGDFGPIYDQFKGKPKEAIEFLIEKKNGDALGVWTRKDIGDIDVVWGRRGDRGYGLDHIIERHIEELKDFSSNDDMSEKISDVINNGDVDEKIQKRGSIVLKRDGYRVSIAKTNGKHWVLTSYNRSIPVNKKKQIEKGLSENNPFEKSSISTVLLRDFSDGKALYPSDDSPLLLHHKYNNFLSENQIIDEKKYRKIKTSSNRRSTGTWRSESQENS